MPRSSYLGLIVVFFAASFGASAFVVAVDPYDLYPWGSSPKFERESYSTDAVPWIVKAVTKSDYDTFYVGASTSAGISATDMREILPGTTKAFNLSLLGASMKDIEIMTDLVAKAPKVRRAVLQLETTFTKGLDATDPRFAHIPIAISSEDITESLRAVDGRALALAWRLMTKREYFVEGWERRNSTQFLDWARAHYRTPQYVAHLAEVVNDNRARLDGPRTSTCADFPALSVLEDFARNLQARGAELDIVFPPYSRAMWFEWVTPGSDFEWDRSHDRSLAVETPLGLFLTMRRCATARMSKYGNARVFAFDLDDGIVANYANYADPAHPANREVYLATLRAIAANDHRVTEGTFQAYESALRDRVMQYRFFDSTSK